MRSENRRCGIIKIPPYSKALSAENRFKFYSPSPLMVTSPYLRGFAPDIGTNVKFLESVFLISTLKKS
jgi:hypothetical protein